LHHFAGPRHHARGLPAIADRWSDEDPEPAYEQAFEHPNPVSSTTPTPSFTEDPVKKTSSKPDIALIVLCGLAAITIGLFIAGWKYLTSEPVENSELTTVQANTAADSESEEADAVLEEEDAAPEKENSTTGTAKTSPSAKAEESKPKAAEKPKTETKPKTEAKPASTASIPAGGITYTHTVRSGETFRGIANRYNLKFETLKALNPQIKDVEKDIKSDVTKLNVKAKAQHTVGPGDILSVVAKKYGVSKELIMTANKKTADRAERGEKLIIPFAEKQ